MKLLVTLYNSVESINVELDTDATIEDIANTIGEPTWVSMRSGDDHWRRVAYRGHNGNILAFTKKDWQHDKNTIV